MKKICIILAALLLCLAMTAYAETAEDATAVLGVISGDTYENAILGIGCTLEGWHYYTEEEIAQNNRLTKEAMGEEIQKILESTQAVQVMIASTPDSTQNVNIQLQTIPSLSAVVETYGLGAIVEASLDTYKTQLEAAGLTDVVLTLGEFTVSGQTLPCLSGSYKMMNIPMFFNQLWITKGDYMGSVTATALSEEIPDTLLANFYLLEQSEEPAA